MEDLYALDIAPTSHTPTMVHKGFKASLMKAPRLPNIGRPHQLPDGTPIPVYPVDALPGAPDGWIRGAGNYVCPVDSEWGLWFSWTENDPYNTAVLPSVKGMNPITGMKLEGFALERYSNKCPIHDIEFLDNLYCSKCNYKWPPQSYVSSPNTLWWDGFRQPDGKVRQFFFTEDEKRDIASLVIGKHNTVPAFGFAFYEPKKRRIMHDHVWRSYEPKEICDTKFLCPPTVIHAANINPSAFFNHSLVGCHISTASVTPVSSTTLGYDECDMAMYSAEVEPSVNTTSVLRSAHVTRPDTATVSVGAGAEIAQDLRPDAYDISSWKDEPSAVIRLYFVFKEQFKRIIKNGGVKDINGTKSGYLEGLPVG